MDCAQQHLNVNRPVFCCPASGTLGGPPVSRADPFHEFEQLFLNGQLKSGGGAGGSTVDSSAGHRSAPDHESNRCHCRSLFSRCEHGAGNRLGAVLRKFARLPGRRTQPTTVASGCNGSGLQQTGIKAVGRGSEGGVGAVQRRGKLNGKPTITVMHDTLVKNNEPVTCSADLRQHPAATLLSSLSATTAATETSIKAKQYANVDQQDGWSRVSVASDSRQRPSQGRSKSESKLIHFSCAPPPTTLSGRSLTDSATVHPKKIKSEVDTHAHLATILSTF